MFSKLLAGRTPAAWTAWLVTIAILMSLTGGVATAQDAEAPAEPAATETAETESGDAPDEADTPAEDDTEAEDADDGDADDGDAASETEAAETVAPGEAGGGAAAAAGAGAPGAGDDAAQTDFASVLIVLAALVVPVVLGNWLAARIGMPDHAWKIATVLTTITVGALAVVYAAYNDGFKGGPDLSGGITLVFETDKEALRQQDGTLRTPTNEEMQDQRGAVKERVDPAGTKEITVRRSGTDRIEIIVPKQSQAELDNVKKQITDLGQLEFRILADPRWTEDEALIAAARKAGPSQKLVQAQGGDSARWVPLKAGAFRRDGLVTREANGRLEGLVKLDLYNVTGEYLQNLGKDFGQRGWVVNFVFNTKGANLFSRFTGENLPNPSTKVERRLGILLNGVLTSAPNLNERIRGRGEISGIGTEQEVDNALRVLKAGKLPIPLNPDPVSEQVVSPAIGKETVDKGSKAIAVSLAAVLVFMLLYYRFAGVVACLALLTNVLLVLAVMVMINAAFTLPGLAGLVLTVGMSVDANVLIFERIREELNRGAALRMAIRNGFDRATTTIVDANITTLITGVVLYTIGTDQIRGFAVTLVLGILMSMYTAIFASRVTFEIAERRRWIKDLKFSSLVGATSIDFLGKRGLAAVASLALIGVGLAAVAQRGVGLLNIDFTGGTSVTMVLDEGQDLSIAEVRTTLEESEYGGGDFTVVEVGKEAAEDGEGGVSRYAIDSSVEQIEEAEAAIAEAFGDRLKTFAVEVGEAEEYTVGEGDDAVTGFRVPLTFNEGAGFDESDGLTHDGLLARIEAVAESLGKRGVRPVLENPGYIEGSSQRFKEWTLAAPGLSAEEAVALATGLKERLESQPLFPVANKISGKVAGDLQLTAIFAILLSLVGIVGYLWFRFQNVSFGLAAVVALVHDVLVTLGAIAISAWVVSGVPSLASALQLDAFQISLPIVAAFLTIIGYSLNDTIVVFDRIREVRGKSPDLTADMINKSINQTLARTLLTSLTTLLVVGILYAFGGSGIHAFAFALVVGVVVGTYSSIFVASPALLAMVGGKQAPQ